MLNINNLTWGQRFKLIDHFELSDDQILSVLQITQEELDSARGLYKVGDITIAVDFDVTPYKGLFIQPIPLSDPSKSTDSPTESTLPPQTASPSQPTSSDNNRRGRKGEKIKNAFRKIPHEPVCATTFAADNNVSLNVLKQSKRFDSMGTDAGKVRTKTCPERGNLLIWREKIEISEEITTNPENRP